VPKTSLVCKSSWGYFFHGNPFEFFNSRERCIQCNTHRVSLQVDEFTDEKKTFFLCDRDFELLKSVPILILRMIEKIKNFQPGLQSAMCCVLQSHKNSQPFIYLWT